MLLAAGIPLGQSLEGLAGSMLYLRGRYDIRSLLLTWSMALRLAGIAVGAHFGSPRRSPACSPRRSRRPPRSASSGWLAFRRFPSAASRPLGEERREIFSFILQSSAATGILSLRGGLAPLLLGAVTNTKQVGLFRVAQAPQSGFQALSAPARMILLTEQTRDWEKGRQSVVLRGVRRYSLVAAGVALVAVPPLLIWIPDIIRHVNGARVRRRCPAARLLSLAAAVQLVVGWTKSFPVTIGRPGCASSRTASRRSSSSRSTLVFGALWGAAGAAAAVLAGMCAFAIIWAVVFLRIDPEDIGAADAGRRHRTGTPVKSSRRLRHLAARRGRSSESRARRRRVPALARPYRRGRGHRERRARAARRIRCTGSRGRCRRARSMCAPGSRSARGARRADVVYTTGMFGRSAFGASSRAASLRDQADGRSCVRACASPRHRRRRRRRVPARRRRRCCAAAARLRATPSSSARRTCSRPSAYLARARTSLGRRRRACLVLPNPAPQLPARRRATSCGVRFGMDGPTLAFAGRLTAQKSLRRRARGGAQRRRRRARDRRRGRRAARRSSGRRGARAPERVQFLGALPRDARRRVFAAADASILSSTWENFPHTSSRRSRSGRRCSRRDGRRRRGRAATVRTACSSRSATPTALARRDPPLFRRRRSCGGACARGRAVGRASTRRSASSRELEQTLLQVARTLAR